MPPDLKGTLGTLLRTTLEQVGALKDAVERQARSQRGWFDTALLERRRKDVLASLGEVVYGLAAAGELGDLEEFPEIERAVTDLESIDQQIAENEERSRLEVEPGSRRRAARAGAGRRGGPDPRERARGDGRVWRPVVPDDDGAEADDDRAAPEPEPAPASRPRRAAAKKRPTRPTRRAARTGGGIAFVDDEASADDPDADLASYMRDDDVPTGSGGEKT
jgi:hypothetical protein